jgi:hypothetical protein
MPPGLDRLTEPETSKKRLVISAVDTGKSQCKKAATAKSGELLPLWDTL